MCADSRAANRNVRRTPKRNRRTARITQLRSSAIEGPQSHPTTHQSRIDTHARRRHISLRSKVNLDVFGDGNKGPILADVRPAPSQRTVLVVEDDPALRDFHRVTLMMAGYHVVAVDDGLSALQLIDSGLVPAIVLLDLGLPRVSGRDVLKELRAHAATRRIPILVVSGMDTRDVDVQPFDCVLRKPVTPDVVLDALSECLQRAAVLSTSC